MARTTAEADLEGGTAMGGTTASVIVKASLSALEYREAAWEAHDLEGKAPDPLPLSDQALRAIVQYEVTDLPVEAREAVETERRRRVLSSSGAERVVALVMLALLGISGLVIGWILLAP